MKQRICSLLAAVLCAAACSEKTDVFYAADYPVTGLAVDVVQEEEGTPLPEARLEALASSVAADAPVQAGGSYRTEFDRADGGVLRVVAAEGEAGIEGSFTKQPAAKRMLFEFGEERYTVLVGKYTGAQAPPAGIAGYTEFRVDVTERYVDRFDAACRITAIYRVEQTSHPVYDLYD